MASRHPAHTTPAGEGHGQPSVRRDRGGGALRRVADRDAAGPQGLQGPARRPGHASPATPSPPTCSTRRAWPPWRAGACWTGWWPPAARRSTPTPSTSAPSPSPAPPGTAEAPVAYAPRRTVLDKLLVDAAAEAGAEVREGFTVEEVVVDERAGHRHPRPAAPGPDRHRARPGRRRRRRPALAGGPGRAAPSSTTSSRRCR